MTLDNRGLLILYSSALLTHHVGPRFSRDKTLLVLCDGVLVQCAKRASLLLHFAVFLRVIDSTSITGDPKIPRNPVYELFVGPKRNWRSGRGCLIMCTSH